MPVRSKAKVKRFRGTPYLDQVKVYFFNGDKLYIGNIADAPSSHQVWEFYQEPGGRLRLQGEWDAAGMHGRASLGQAYLNLERRVRPGQPPEWWLFSLGDTAVLRTFAPLEGDTLGRLYLQRRDPRRSQAPPLEIPLLAFATYRQPQQLLIAERPALTDYSPLFRLTAVLLAHLEWFLKEEK